MEEEEEEVLCKKGKKGGGNPPGRERKGKVRKSKFKKPQRFFVDKNFVVTGAIL